MSLPHCPRSNRLPQAERIAVRACSIVLTLLLSAIVAQECRAQGTVWGLSRGDRFSALTTIEQKTTVSVGGDEPATTSNREQIFLSYFVEQTVADGVIVRVQIPDMRGDAGFGAGLSRVEGSTCTLHLDRQGRVLTARGQRLFVQRLTESDAGTESVLLGLYPQESLTSLIARPFWLATDEVPLTTDTSWSRTDHVSLGLLGAIRTAATVQVSDIDDQNVSVALTGRGEHLPVVQGPASPLIRFQDVTAKLDSFSGSGKMVIVPEDSAQRRRPWLDKLELSWTVSGEATLKTGDQAQPVMFSETQTQTTKLLPGYRVGRQRFPELPSIIGDP